VEDAEVERLIGKRPRVSYADIVRHARLRDAMRVYLDRFLAVYGGDPFLVRLLIEMGRYSLVHLVMLLEAGHEPAKRETWPTLGRVKELMAAYGFGSGRHVDDLIMRLCEVGFLEMYPSEHDRRTKMLKCTEMLWAHDRDWLAAHFAPLAVCYPQHGYAPALNGDRQFQVAFRRASVPFIPIGAKLIQFVPDMTLFLEHAGGYMVIAALLQAALASGDGVQTAVPYADIGERFGLSRTHVRRLLARAQENGLVKLQARGGHRVAILPRLWASHDRGISCGMFLNDMVYVATLDSGAAHASPQAGGRADDRPPDGRGRLRQVK
jgi:DNA-binding MarR family transcriptional regulator